MDWNRIKFTLDRFESMVQANVKELKQHYRRIQQLEEEDDYESSIIEKNNAKQLIDQLLVGLKQILELRTQLAEDYHDMFDSTIAPIRQQIQSLTSAFNSLQRPRSVKKATIGSGNMFDDCFNNGNQSGNTSSIYEQQLMTQATLNPKLEELRLCAEQRKMDAEASEKLAHDIDDLNQMMTDLAQLVHNQHELVDSIEESVERSVHDVQSGHQQLKKAVASNNAKYPLMAAGVGSVVIGGPAGFFASSAVVGIAAAVGGAFAGLYGGRVIKRQANKAANE